jgi:hypothetical protein
MMSVGDLPHTYFYTCFYSKAETKVETSKDSTGYKNWGVQIFIE